MHRTINLPVTALNEHFTCVLCGGYLIDATTIIECLHSFCKVCIVQYLEKSYHCPICDVQVHKTKPLTNLRLDQTLQDLVYKLVPGLLTKELSRRKEFHAGQPNSDSARLDSSLIRRNPLITDEHISISLEYSPDGKPLKGEDEVSAIDAKSCLPKLYLLCPAEFPILQLKRFLQLRLNLKNDYWVNVFHIDEPLRDSYTLIDVAYIYTWRRRGPLKIFYSLHMSNAKTEELSMESGCKLELQKSKDCCKLQNAVPPKVNSIHKTQNEPICVYNQKADDTLNPEYICQNEMPNSKTYKAEGTQKTENALNAENLCMGSNVQQLPHAPKSGNTHKATNVQKTHKSANNNKKAMNVHKTSNDNQKVVVEKKSVNVIQKVANGKKTVNNVYKSANENKVSNYVHKSANENITANNVHKSANENITANNIHKSTSESRAADNVLKTDNKIHKTASVQKSGDIHKAVDDKQKNGDVQKSVNNKQKNGDVQKAVNNKQKNGDVQKAVNDKLKNGVQKFVNSKHKNGVIHKAVNDKQKNGDIHKVVSVQGRNDIQMAVGVQKNNDVLKTPNVQKGDDAQKAASMQKDNNLKQSNLSRNDDIHQLAHVPMNDLVNNVGNKAGQSQKAANVHKADQINKDPNDQKSNHVHNVFNVQKPETSIKSSNKCDEQCKPKFSAGLLTSRPPILSSRPIPCGPKLVTSVPQLYKAHGKSNFLNRPKCQKSSGSHKAGKCKGSSGKTTMESQIYGSILKISKVQIPDGSNRNSIGNVSKDVYDFTDFTDGIAPSSAVYNMSEKKMRKTAPSTSTNTGASASTTTISYLCRPTSLSVSLPTSATTQIPNSTHIPPRLSSRPSDAFHHSGQSVSQPQSPTVHSLPINFSKNSSPVQSSLPVLKRYGSPLNGFHVPEKKPKSKSIEDITDTLTYQAFRKMSPPSVSSIVPPSSSEKLILAVPQMFSRNLHQRVTLPKEVTL